MGTYNPGAFGAFSGKVGYIVAAKWRGKDVVKNYSQKLPKKPSIAQLAQRERLSFVNRFLNQFAELIHIGYCAADPRMLPMNMASSYHLKNAVIGEYPAYQMNYPILQLSFHKGIDAAVKPELSLQQEGKISVNWQMARFSSIQTRADDLAYILLYNPEKDRFLKSEGHRRAELRVEITVSETFKGDHLHGWIFFVSSSGKLASATQYLGEIQV